MYYYILEKNVIPTYLQALPVDPVNNGIFGFIYSVRVPGVGIWFQDNKVNTLTLLQNETWTSGVHLTNMRFKHCTVMISPTVAAIIGGRVGSITSVTQFKIFVEKV